MRKSRIMSTQKTKELLNGYYLVATALVVVVVLSVAVMAWRWWQGYAQVGSAQEPALEAGQVVQLRPVFTNDLAAENQLPAEPVPFKIESVAQNLEIPWDMVFTGPDRMIFSERTGAIWAMISGELQSEPLLVFEEIAQSGEAGLMGLAIDPNYQQNRYLYVCLAYPDEGGITDRIERLIDRGDRLEQDQVILDQIPAAQFHAGCQLGFGPDDKLYASTGDALDKNLAQDRVSLAGKILRMNRDGSVPADNPFPDSLIYSLGHRNSQGFDWHPVSGELYASEHGPSLFDGPAGGDEINWIQAGQNYGWPEVSHLESDPDYYDPLLVFTPAEAPASGHFYTGDVFPQFTNQFLVGALRGEGLLAIEIDPRLPDQVIQYQKLPIEVGRIRAVTTSPDGLIYFATSNQDGRGELNPGDDQIYRLVPASD